VFGTGVTIGWSRVIAGYWIHPVLRFIGPLPAIGVALAAARLVLRVSRRAASASTFLIALATRSRSRC
jgi:NitT/TauT family transport system permease protein